MKCNIGETDRKVRTIIAFVFLILGMFVNPWFYVLTVLLMLTVLMGYCGLYSILKIDTTKVKAKEVKKKKK